MEKEKSGKLLKESFNINEVYKISLSHIWDSKCNLTHPYIQLEKLRNLNQRYVKFWT